MSRENVDLHRWIVEAYNRRDYEGLAAKLAPDVEWVPALIGRADNRPEDEFRGIEGYWRWVAETREVMDEYTIEPDQYRDAGDGRVLMLGQIRGRGRASGAEVRAPLGQVMTFREGRVVSYRGYLDLAEALEAVGLQE